MRTLSEQILQCVTLAGDGRYTKAQVADILSQTEDWVEQVLAAWEYNPKAYVQRPDPVYQFDTTWRPKPLEPSSMITNMTYDTGPRIKPVDSASQRTNMTYDPGNSATIRPVTYVYDASPRIRVVQPTSMRTNMIYDLRIKTAVALDIHFRQFGIVVVP